MPQELSITVDRPIGSVSIDGSGVCEKQAIRSFQQAAVQDIHSQLAVEKQALTDSIKLLHNTVQNLNSLSERLTEQQKADTVRLSIAIANKILTHRAQQGDYDIEDIISKTLASAPINRDIIIKLNPDDLAAIQKADGQGIGESFENLKFIADISVKRGDCVVETPKGIVEHIVEDSLDKIEKALLSLDMNFK